MTYDIVLTFLRFYSCYLLSLNSKSAWLVSIITAIFKIMILRSVNLETIANGKLVVLATSLFALQKWKEQDMNQKSIPTKLIQNKLASKIINALTIILTVSLLIKKTLYQEIIATILNLLATYLAAFRKKECWILWIAYDILLADLFFRNHLILSASTTLLYIPIAFFGQSKWSFLMGSDKKLTTVLVEKK